MVGTSGSCSWYSPKAETYSATTADLPLIKKAVEMGDPNVVSRVWVADIAAVQHKIIIGLPCAGGLQWFHPWHHFDKSCALGWPGSLTTVPGAELRIFVHDADAKQPAILPLTTLDNIAACTFEWKAWSWVRGQPMAPSSLPLRSFCWIVSGPGPCLEIVARRCFWCLGRSTIERFASSLGAAIPEGSSMVEALSITIKAIIPDISEPELLQVLAQRLCTNDLSAAFSESLMEIDEAAEVLDRDDTERLHKEAKTARNETESKREFARDYSALQERVRANQKSKLRAKKAVRLPANLQHWEAKQHIPPPRAPPYGGASSGGSGAAIAPPPIGASSAVGF